uniref:Uncharacterized protein n=1 Tax=Heliothis virescens TaxID=7102 RepID=A0A2A4K2Q2_HELVI
MGEYIFYNNVRSIPRQACALHSSSGRCTTTLPYCTEPAVLQCAAEHHPGATITNRPASAHSLVTSEGAAIRPRFAAAPAWCAERGVPALHQVIRIHQ